ncbi:enolase C-terminal domain-like protein [Acidisoma silvae]|uniref:Mandelate racemase n=1 Tax=Acidisoma silvae TaxID=2802396 RepID=A0A963YWV6_9PROT|nr:enolase C-terminal domain-like protein [Acidisoma silvae]MCB8878334.1 mandelate racemase [Acidisoma silvae]
MLSDLPIRAVSARAFTVPTDAPEADGTFAWEKTTLVFVEVHAGGKTGIGYTYADACLVKLIDSVLAAAITGRDVLAIGAAWLAMQRAVRNLGRSGLASCAISAIDVALWDLKAKLLDLPLARLLGSVRQSVPIYGSGGFTTYSDSQIQDQLAGWVERDGCRAVKMKIGTHPDQDPHRVDVARRAIGTAALFVDANGALSARQACYFGKQFAETADIRWFEEPVSSDDLPGLRFVRDHSPAGIDIAAGEYVYTQDDARLMLASGAVDVQQADVTRCGGITGFLAIGNLCDAHHVDLSGHCAPAVHLHAACAAPRFRHLEWFHDHVRIERMFFDGAPQPVAGTIRPDLSRPGLGLTLKAADAERYAV